MSTCHPSTEPLYKEVVWHMTIKTPLHVGSGDKLVWGKDVFFDAGRAHVIDLGRAFDALEKEQASSNSPDRHKSALLADLDRVMMRDSAKSFQELWGARSRDGIVLYSMPCTGGELAARGPDAKAELRTFMRDAFQRPFLPGSTLKGAIRTALLMEVAERNESVKDAFRVATATKQKSPDTRAQHLAFRSNGKEPEKKDAIEAIEDVLRHLHVPDVYIPPDCIEVRSVAIASMGNPDGDDWGWKERPTKNQAHWKGGLRIVLESIRPGTELRIPLRIDARRLRPDWLHIPKEDLKGRVVQDFSNRRALLENHLFNAIKKHGRRIFEHDQTLFLRRSKNLPPGLTKTLHTLTQSTSSAGDMALLPVAWGIGWRGMTGAVFERLDNSTGERERNVCAHDPPTLRRLRTTSGMGKTEYPIFPKTRRLALDQTDPTLPMGWVSIRPWAANDAVGTVATVRMPSRNATVQIKLEGQNKNGTWRGVILGYGARGYIDPKSAPPDLRAGQVVTATVEIVPVSKDAPCGLTFKSTT
ncbi:MAG: type III-A CRISPR-associated RAMP protein Csm5 [Polyangiaceae bacterium]|nr:type III-A CRISPR-associated RAMP protein Csm5 [Polyangiaceae bacterium]